MERNTQNKTFSILIVDDVPQNIQVVASILHNEGYQMAFAQDGRTALESVGKNDFDLILLDVIMPAMDGYEVCKALKQSPNTVDIPVIFLTVKDETEDIVKGFETGAVDYVTKPFNAAELLSRVRTHLELKRIKDNQKLIITGLKAALEESKRAEKAVKARKRQFRAFIEEMPVGIFTYAGTRFGYLNPACERITGYTRDELMEMDLLDIAHPEFKKSISTYMEQRQRGEPVPKLHEFRIITKGGEERWLERQSTDISLDGKPQTLVIVSDVTTRKLLEIALQKGHEELERLVEERTLALTMKNKDLGKEIENRRRAERQLQKGKGELELKSGKLEDLNSALKVLLKQREDDRIELENKVLTNVKHLLFPHLETLKKKKLDSESKTLLDILESNLMNIISPFSHRLSSKHMNLTPTEIKVANLIREEKSTKEIARMLMVSENVVNQHRYHIRKKLGILAKKVNLRSYLASLS